MATNLPAIDPTVVDSAERTRLYFNSYGDTPESYNSNDVSAAIAFFTKRNYTEDAAITVAMTVLQQARRDQIPVFEILDSLETFDSIKINALVAGILNNNRTPSSAVGFNTEVKKSFYARNVLP